MLQETINHIEAQLKEMKESGENMKNCSFVAEMGVLLTGEQADFILGVLESQKSETSVTLLVPGDPLYFGFDTGDKTDATGYFVPDLEADL